MNPRQHFSPDLKVFCPQSSASKVQVWLKIADWKLAGLTCAFFSFLFGWLGAGWLDLYLFSFSFLLTGSPFRQKYNTCKLWCLKIWGILLWHCAYTNRSIKTYFHFLQMVIRVVQFRHWTGSRVQKCDPFEQVLWKMKSLHIQLAKVRVRTETEVASLQTSDCTRLCADLNGKFNFTFSRPKNCFVIVSVWLTRQWVIYIHLMINFCLSLPKRVHENRGCVADEIISTIFVLIRWNACFNFWTLTMKVRWKWKRKCKWREKDSATADVKAPVCLHASPNADLIQMLTFVLYHITLY